jgi:SAM-dependent methyltransferase
MPEYYKGKGVSLYELVEKGLPGDTELYLREAKKAKGKVLEIGCGTGRIYLELLKAGMDAYGLDASGEMLLALKKKAKEMRLSPKVKKADMRSFSYPLKFDLIIIPYRGFNHILTRDGQKKCLRNIREHLKKGGKLVLDFFDPNYIDICAGKMHEQEEYLEGTEKCLAEWTMTYDTLKQVAHLHCKVSSNSKAREMDVKILYIFPREFENLLELCGFKKWKVYGGFNYEPHTKNGQELVWVVEK